MIPQTLFNTNLFVAGVSFAGDVPTLTLPQLQLATDDYRAGGMDGTIDMDMGLQKMEASFTTNGVRPESLSLFGLADGNGFSGTFRGSFKGQGGVTTAVVATIRGTLKTIDPGDWSAGTKAEIKHTVGVTYYKLQVGGTVIYEIDPVNAIRIIDGTDQLASMRSDLGL